MDRQQQPRWRPTRRQLIWSGVLAVGAFLLIVICGYLFGWNWTGLPRSEVPPNTQPTKTLWDWLSLLIVPIVLALGGYLFTRSENQRTQRIADERRQDDTLQAYLDGMSQLLTDKERPLHRALPGDSLSSVARARTLTVLPRLDGDHKARVVQFLYESGLIAKGSGIVDLRDADLSGVVLPGAVLIGAKLNGAVLADANLRNASLSKADLRGVDLRRANLNEALLLGADLSVLGPVAYDPYPIYKDRQANLS